MDLQNNTLLLLCVQSTDFYPSTTPSVFKLADETSALIWKRGVVLVFFFLSELTTALTKLNIQQSALSER